MGLPLVHISFKYRPNRLPVPARGVIAIGQFGRGITTISQFGIGLISVSQFTIAGFALAQFALACSLIAQTGMYIREGRGQIVKSLKDSTGFGSPTRSASSIWWPPSGDPAQNKPRGESAPRVLAQNAQRTDEGQLHDL